MERFLRLLGTARVLTGWVRRFTRFVAQRFVNENGLEVAASLAYTSLLSLVPLMAVTFSMLAAFPSFRSLGNEIQDFIFSNFVPASGEVVKTYVQNFATKASRLTSVGIIFLVVTALMMMSTIDKALNAIWRSEGQRSPVARFVVYWSTLTLGPLLVGVGLVATSYLSSLPMFGDGETIAGLKARLLVWMPLISTALGFTLLYVVVPSRSVPLRPAIMGGVFAAVLFEYAKRGFAWYVTNFPTYEAIYGALATVPIFLIWIYLSWVIILLGAVLAHSLEVYKDQPGVSSVLPPGARLVLGVRVVGHLWLAQTRGDTLTANDLLTLEPRLEEEEQLLESILEDLGSEHWVHHTDTGSWALARDLSQLSLLALYRAMPGPLPQTREAVGDAVDPWNAVLLEVMRAVGRDLETSMAVPLKDVYQPSQPVSPVATAPAEFPAVASRGLSNGGAGDT